MKKMSDAGKLDKVKASFKVVIFDISYMTMCDVIFIYANIDINFLIKLLLRW